MERRPPLWLTTAAVLVYVFLLGPMLIVAGTALSRTEFLTFPPQGLTLQWFANVFAVSAFVRSFG